MPNKIYINPETPHVWTDTGGDDTLDLGSLAAGSVRVGDQWDMGAGPRASKFAWRMIVDGFDTAPVVGESVDIYLATSDGTNHDGDIGTTDGAGTTVSLPNLVYLGSAIVQTTTAANELIVSGTVEINERYVSPVIHNNTADALLGTSDAHQFILTPIPDEVQ